jgi:hypothetical protein
MQECPSAVQETRALSKKAHQNNQTNNQKHTKQVNLAQKHILIAHGFKEYLFA